MTFNLSNKPDTCKWCGKKLAYRMNTELEKTDRKPGRCQGTIYGPYASKRQCEEVSLTWDGSTSSWRCKDGHHTSGARRIKSRVKVWEKPGYLGNGEFCTLTCGYRFGVAAARNGYRFQPKSKS